MLTDKDGREVSLKEVLGHLIGTDDDDMAKSVIDFAVYPINEDKTVDDPTYYLIATEAIITQISFMGPFTMLELDFRNVEMTILQQVMNVVNKFHSDINTDSLLMLSTITPLEKDATHILSLMNPLVCVRGYSEKGNGSTILQLIYATENIAFSLYEIDHKLIDADIDREIRELESMQVTEEALAAAQDVMDNDYNNSLKDMFTPEFGLKTPEDKLKKNMDGVRTSSSGKISSKKNVRVGSSEESNIRGVGSDDEDNDIPENRV